MRHTLRVLVNLLGVAALLFSTTPGLTAQAEDWLEGACPCHACRHRAAQASQGNRGRRSSCPKNCTCSRCCGHHHHNAHHEHSAPGEGCALEQDTLCPLCPSCPGHSSQNCCASQAPCCLPVPASAPGHVPCLSQYVPESSLQFPAPLATSLLRPPRA
jgi:hypothetical protein